MVQQVYQTSQHLCFKLYYYKFTFLHEQLINGVDCDLLNLIGTRLRKRGHLII
jgi:hypothetical protein